MTDFIPVNTPALSGREREYVLECIDTGWISSEGPFIGRFEKDMATTVGRKHGVAVANGTAALEIAVAALDIGPGDEVIMPTFTIISCAAAVTKVGGMPVFVDSDPLTWNMDVRAVAEAVTEKTRAIMVVHIYGLPVDMGPLLELSERLGIPIIEDAAEMHGQTWNGRLCGSFGALSTFSFYPNKHITTGEGGMILADDDNLAQRCASLRNLAFQPNRRFVHEEIGWNYRMTNLQAALGVAQLERLDQAVVRKREIGARYQAALGNVGGIQLPLARTDYAENIYWVFGLVLDDNLDTDATEVMARLAERGIGTRPFFWPMHEQPVFLKLGWYADSHFPVAERLARRGLYLPSGLGITDGQIERSAEALKAVLSDIPKSN